MIKKKKSPLIAALLSAFAFPGLGQVYAKCYAKGLIFIVITMILFISIAVPLITIASSYASEMANLESMSPSKFTMPNDGRIKWFSILLTVAWIISIVDAWSCAKRLNKQISISASVDVPPPPGKA